MNQHLTSVFSHIPEDMTVTLDAGMSLADLQAALAKSGQWLPLDPVNSALSIREILDRNETGPRRYGYGMAREYVIGLTITLADGRIVKSGGKVVKNVAGYDLQKLFIGSGGTLGTIREVTFKLRPIPESSSIVRCECDLLEAAGAVIERVFESELTPVVFDLYRVEGGRPVLVLGFDGTQDEVEWQLALAVKLGVSEAATLDYDKSFRADAASLRKLSVLPSKLIEALRGLGDAPFVARAGNGIVFHRADINFPVTEVSPVVQKLQRRLKDTFDPQHCLPELPA